MRPLIGICSEFEEWHPKPGVEHSYLKLYHDYYHAITRAGGLPVAIPVFEDPELALELLPRFDGILLTGGDDLRSLRYGEPLHPASRVTPPWREAQDLAVATHLLGHSRQPVLAICMGMQTLAVASGGRIVQDIPTCVPNSIQHRGGSLHAVEVDQASALARWFGQSPEVHSSHHQAVAEVGGELRVSAVAPDGVIEAAESRDESRFLVAVQWHPERQPTYRPSAELFKAFVAAAARARR